MEHLSPAYACRRRRRLKLTLLAFQQTAGGREIIGQHPAFAALFGACALNRATRAPKISATSAARPAKRQPVFRVVLVAAP